MQEVTLLFIAWLAALSGFTGVLIGSIAKIGPLLTGFLSLAIYAFTVLLIWQEFVRATGPWFG